MFKSINFINEDYELLYAISIQYLDIEFENRKPSKNVL